MSRIYFLFGCLILILLSSCSPIYYTPNTQNVPLLEQKGQANIGLTGNGNQYEIQASYGLSDHMAIMANAGIFRPEEEGDDGGSGNFYEVGLGYFTALTDNIFFETYGLFGYGSMENHFPSTIDEFPLTNGDISANILRFGIQPNLGFKYKRFMVALSTRLVSLNYKNIQGDLFYESINQVDYLKLNESSFVVEPAITVRLRLGDKFNLQTQLGRSFNINEPEFRHEDVYLTFGLNYSILGKENSDQ